MEQKYLYVTFYYGLLLLRTLLLLYICISNWKWSKNVLLEISGSEEFLMWLFQFPSPIVNYFWKKKSKSVYSVLYKVENWGILCELCVSLDNFYDLIGYEFVALIYSCTSSICPTLLCKMIATLDCVHYLWLFNADLCNSKYHLEINFENLPPKVNKQDKDLWTQY